LFYQLNYTPAYCRYIYGLFYIYRRQDSNSQLLRRLKVNCFTDYTTPQLCRILFGSYTIIQLFHIFLSTYPGGFLTLFFLPPAPTRNGLRELPGFFHYFGIFHIFYPHPPLFLLFIPLNRQKGLIDPSQKCFKAFLHLSTHLLAHPPSFFVIYTPKQTKRVLFGLKLLSSLFQDNLKKKIKK
jgi:hypothetical protein